MTMTEIESTDDLVRRKLDELLSSHSPDRTPPDVFLGHQFDAGLAWVYFPVGQGGLGVSHRMQRVVNERLAGAGAPNPLMRNPIGYGNCAPTLVQHGTDWQVARLLRPLFTGEEIWCQLFSEPGAGSDLASLATRAVQDGDSWILNGQKVWTTMAHVARWGLALARTDVEVSKHAGITCFVIDMTAPGIEVRPLRQMTGEAEFNEVYLNDHRVPDEARLGPEGAGWRVAISTLASERSAIGSTAGRASKGPMAETLRLLKERAGHNPVRRDRLAQLWIRTEVVRMTRQRAAQNRARGAAGPEESVIKLLITELNKSVSAAALECVGADGMLYDSYEMTRPDTVFHASSSVQRSFLRARANSIEGGTSEIMRNVLAERVLGLPGEPRTDRDLPWSNTLRS